MKYRWFIFFSLVGALMLYTLRQLMRFMPGHPFSATLATVLLFLLMFFWQFMARAGAARLDTFWFRLLAWTGSIALGIWATCLVLWLPVDVVHTVYALGRSLWTDHPVAVLAFLPRGNALLGGIFILSVGLAGLGLEEALTGPQIKEVEIPCDSLPKELNGLKIVHLSDLHVGPMIRRGYVEGIVREIEALKPDVIVLTGDLVDGTVALLADQVEPLSRLRAPYGMYFSTGNHEYYWGVQPWLRKLREMGWIPLVNENRLVDVQGATLLIAGIPDLTAPHFEPTHVADIPQAVKSDRPAAFRILLAHRPSSANAAEAAGVNLMLSGHTHGGQFFPFNLMIPYFYRYSRGFYRHGALRVYVNPGTGYWGPPHRFLVPAEITLLRLTAS